MRFKIQRIMKRSTNIYVTVILLFLFTGCSERFLDRYHPGTLGYDKLYITESDFEAALSGCYQSIMETSTNTIYLGELPSDNTYVSQFQSSGTNVDLDRLGFTAETGIFSSYWSSNYTTIQRVNLLIDKIAGSAINPAASQRIIAEAKFLRAYSYFNLVRVFGGVPLYSGYVELSAMYDVPRASEEEVFDLIISDLSEASNLDAYRTAEERAAAGGRATTAAAQTLLGKAYLWKRDFQAAENILSGLIDDGYYGLVPLETLYDPDQPFNEEIIFSINYDRASGFGSPFTNAVVPYNAPQGLVYPNVQERTGSGLLMIEPYVFGKFADNDARKTALLRQITFENLGNIDDHIYSLKYIDANTTFNGLSGANTIVLRYADVLLMYAEALNENGQTGNAVGYINQVRNRAGVDGLPETLSAQQVFEALADERQREFLLEGDRWFDLRYRGINYLKETMGAFLPNAYLPQNRELQLFDRFILFPIPEGQRQIKPILDQNEGY